MAGLEVAGVVLGSIPLVISALEHYSNGIRIVTDMANYSDIFEDYRTQLEASITIYMNTCYELLGPLNLSDSQMKALLFEGQEDAWANPDLQASLKVRLGANHHIYTSLQEKLNKRILLFRKKMKIESNGQLPWIVSDGTVDEKARKKFFKSFRVKTMGGFNTKEYGTLLDKIDRDIEKLSKLLHGTIQLEPIKMEKQNKLKSAHWQDIRDQAQRLFDSLSSRFLPCACKHSHQANLRLETRGHRQKEQDRIRFALVLTFDKISQTSLSPPWEWRDIEIESSELVNSTLAVPTPQVQTPVRRTAHFAPSITISQIPPISRTPSSTPATRIDSLCQTLVGANQKECCLGVLEDQSWQHHVYLVRGPASTAQITEAASVKDIIHGPRRIGARQKCTLALTLACSVLQLHNTQWLPNSWEPDDICFLKTHNGDPIPSQFYVSQTFTSVAAVSATTKTRRLVKNEMIYSLGVALLEIAHGASIQSFKKPEDLGEDGREDSITELSIANRLARELNTHESPNYARAVLRCITCSFDTFALDLNEQEFREAFYQGVVVPLQEDYKHVTGQSL